jgi:hypothetical protein
MITYLCCVCSYVTSFSRRNSFQLHVQVAILYSKLSHLQCKNVTKFTVLRDKWARISMGTCNYEWKCSLPCNFCPKRKSSLGDHKDKIATTILSNTNNNNKNEVLVRLMTLCGFRCLLVFYIDSFPCDPSLNTVFTSKTTSLRRPTFLVNTLSHFARWGYRLTGDNFKKFRIGCCDSDLSLAFIVQIISRHTAHCFCEIKDLPNFVAPTRHNLSH